MREGPRNPEITFWRVGAFVVESSPAREPTCISVPAGIVMKVCLWLSWFFFEDYQHNCPFNDEWLTSAPAHTALSVQQFLTKNGMTSMPYPPYSPDLTPSNFLCFLKWIKSSKGNVLVMWRKWNKQKMAEALKGFKINEFKHCFEQWKKTSQ